MMTLELLKKELAVATLQQKLAKEVGLHGIPTLFSPYN